MPRIEQDGFGISLEEIYYLGKAVILDIVKPGNKPLNYDVPWLLQYYSKTSDGENMLRSSDKTLIAPYEISFDYRNNAIKNWGTFRYTGDFQLTNELAIIREKLIKIYLKKGLLHKGNNICPRIKKLSAKSNTLVIEIEKASYFDQVATNLSLDYPLHKTDSELIGAKTLREWDIKQSATKKGTLPTFYDSKLANTIGVAVGITATNKHGQKVILIRKRTRNVAVSAEMYVLPFSFSLNMETKDLEIGGGSSIFDLIKSDFRDEQREELGLDPNILAFEKVKPLLLCRELCRGGKPQFFFEIELDIPFEALKKQIKENGLTKKEFKNVIEGWTFEKARKMLNKLSPELMAFIVAKS